MSSTVSNIVLQFSNYLEKMSKFKLKLHMLKVISDMINQIKIFPLCFIHLEFQFPLETLWMRWLKNNF